MYYIVFFNDDEEAIVAECGTLVDEGDNEWSLEQCGRMYTWDTVSEQLGYYAVASDMSYRVFDEDSAPQKHKTWKAAIYSFIDLIDYLGMNHREMIARVIEGRFTDKKALIRLWSEVK